MGIIDEPAGFTGDHNLGFEDLNGEEQDLIMMLRRLKDRYREDRIQIVTFIGDESDARLTRSFALGVTKLSEDDSYKGETIFILQKVPHELEGWHAARHIMHDSVDEMCGRVLDIAARKRLMEEKES